MTSREGVLVGIVVDGARRADSDGTEPPDSDGTATDRRVIGIGEATPLPGWTESFDDCRRALPGGERLDDSAEDAAGASPPADPRRGSTPTLATPAARHAVTLAHRDAFARRRGLSVAETLIRDRPGELSETVAVNATVGDGSVADTVEAATSAVAAGFETVKLKVGARPLAEDTERVRRVVAAVEKERSGSVGEERSPEAVGEERPSAAVGEESTAGTSQRPAGTHATADPGAPGPTIRVDANGAWDRQTAREALVELDGLVEYVEQPVAAADTAGLTALRGVGAPVAADEALTVSDPFRLLAAGAVDVVVCKPAALGGLTRTLALARAAAARGVDTVVTTTIDGVVARTAATHLAAVLPGGERAHGLATGQLLAHDIRDRGGHPVVDPVPVENGRITVPDGPGLAGGAFETLL
jgi:L-alanine-DL-glutamate epimerase-like enolase superfamily enzyme